MAFRNKPSITITLPKSIYDLVTREAERTGRNRSQMIATLIKAQVERKDPSLEPIYEAAYAADVDAIQAHSPLLMDHVISLARSGLRSLELEGISSADAARAKLEEKQPALLAILQAVASSTPIDPRNLQPFNERFWPFPLRELETIRSVYSLLWREAHAATR
jgi:hypothetical protein